MMKIRTTAEISAIQESECSLVLNIFFFTISTSFWHRSCTRRCQRKSFSPSGNSYSVPCHHWPCIFRRLQLANRVLQPIADEVARNGAPSKINFGQRFSWTPLAFSLQLGFIWPTADLPQSLPLADEVSR